MFRDKFREEPKVIERFCRVRCLRPTVFRDYFKKVSVDVEPGDTMDVSEGDAALLREAGFCLVLTQPEMPR
jgi:hypothetical protein